MYIYIILIITSFFLSTCSFDTKNIFEPETNNIGANKLDILNLKIKKGKTNKSYIIEKLGPPSIENPFNKNIIYYISQDMEHEIAKSNKIAKLVLLEITFDKNNYVENFQLVEKDEIKQFVLNDDEDRNLTNDRTTFNFIKNLLDNLRRKQDID